MSQDDKILLRYLQEEDLPVLAQLANNKKYGLMYGICCHTLIRLMTLSSSLIL